MSDEDTESFQDGMKKIRFSFREKSREKLVPPARPPRFDEVYEEGVKWLNRVARQED